MVLLFSTLTSLINEDYGTKLDLEGREGSVKEDALKREGTVLKQEGGKYVVK